MGRKKLEIKRIEDKNHRQVTFSKRRGGLLKKAKQLSILCDVQIGGIIFSSRGKLHQFSHGNSLDTILEQYRDISNADGREATGIHEHKNSERAKSWANKNLLQRVQGYLDDLNLDHLTVADLAQLEKELETALVQIRATKVSVNTQQMMEPIGTLRDEEKLLSEENEHLKQQIATMLEKNIVAKEMGDDRGVDIELRNLANNETEHSPPQQTLNLLF